MKIPKYQQIKDDLKAQLKSGKFESGDRFYTEAELIDLYNVSSITVIRAIKELTREGYLVRQQGKGTFVSRARKGSLVEFSDIEFFQPEKDKVTVISLKKGNDERILNKLNLKKDAHYYLIERIRYEDGQPYIYHSTYLPAHYVREDIKDKNYYSSIYNRLKTDFDLHMMDEHSTETNEIVFPTPEPAAQYLGLDNHSPSVYQVKTTKRRLTNEVLEYVETYKRWDFFKIEFSTVQNQ